MSYFVFAGGGTGGHLFPALAVAAKLRASPSGGFDVASNAVEIAFFCTLKPIDADILGKAGMRAMPLSVQAFPSRPWQWLGFYLRWRESVAQCVGHFRARRPAAVIGAGGYASGPPVHAAMRLGIPTYLLNPDAVPGRANLHMGARRGISGIFAQWEVTRDHFPSDAPVIVTGCPVRSSFLAAIGSSPSRPPLTPPCKGGDNKRGDDKRGDDKRGDKFAPPLQGGDGGGLKRDALAAAFGLDPHRRTLLVTGASQGARTINEAMVRLAPIVAAADWQVLHLAGAADVSFVRQAYANAEIVANVLPFTDRMAEAMLLSDVIISRAGASSLAEILAVGRPSILFPYPFHRDRHQRHNGQVLVDAGAAFMLVDTKESLANAHQLEPVLHGLLGDDARREAMGEAARRLGRPEAADEIASILLETAGSGIHPSSVAPVGLGVRAA